MRIRSGRRPRRWQAIRAALSELNRYPDGGSFTLCNKIAARHKVKPEQIFMGSGSCEIINLLAFLFLRPGLNAISSEHAFAIYPLATASTGATYKSVPMRNGFEFDLDAIAAAVDDNTRIIYLGNPNNPTGTIYRRAEWKRFLAKVPQRVVIVADEAYFEFVRDAEYPDSMQDHDGTRLLITLRTFSKIFGLAGLRVGYGVARPDIITLLNKVRQPFNITTLAQVAVAAGMDDIDHVNATLRVNREGMEYLEREFARLKIGYVPSQANFILARSRRWARRVRQAAASGSHRAPDAWLRLPAPRAHQRGLAGRESALDRGARKSFVIGSPSRHSCASFVRR